MSFFRNIFFTFVFCWFTQQVNAQTIANESVYPNPFSDTTTVHVDILTSDTVTLQVLNRWGVVIHTFFDHEIVPTGSYHLGYNTDSLEKGSYILIMKMGEDYVWNQNLLKISTNIQEQHTSSFHLWPNPATDVIQMNIDGPKTIQITNTAGQTVMQFSTNEQTVAINKLPMGVYYVTVENKDETFFQTLTVVR